jgi:hypothetical protein
MRVRPIRELSGRPPTADRQPSVQDRQPSVHLLAAAHVEGLAGDVGGQVGREVGTRVADVPGGLRTAKRDAGQEGLPAGFPVQLAQDSRVGVVPQRRAYHPGQTAFTVTWCPATSLASARVSPITPNFVAQ